MAGNRNEKDFIDDEDILKIGEGLGILVTEQHDYIAVTYVASGDGIGEVETLVFQQGGSGGVTVATLTATYNGDDKLASLTKT